MNKLNKIIYIFIGIIILLTPLLLMPILKKQSKQVVLEMDFRNPLTLQEVIESNNKTKSFESFFSDYLPFRKTIITFWSNINDTIGVTTNKDKVILGQNGYKFLSDDSEKYLAQYRNTFDFSRDDINNTIEKIYTLKEYLSKYDIGFLYVICPNKHHIYEEYMPKWTTKSYKDNYIYEFDLAIRQHDLSQNYTFLAEDLIEEKQEYGDFLYYKTDSHWTKLGAFFGYSSIIDSINNQNGFDLKKVQLKNYDTEKSNGYELARNQGINKKDIDFSVDVSFYPNNNPEPEYLTEDANWKTLKLTTNPDGLNDMTILIIRDSFYSSMECYFVNTFTYVYDVHYNVKTKDDHSNFLIDIIEDYNPDFVVFETIARSAAFETNIMPKTY